MSPINIFLSHISCEANLADIIVRQVTRDFIGLAHPFASTQASILVGTRWLNEVTMALNQSHLHVVLASPDSVKRKWINFEAGAAHVRGVPIIPLCHSGLTTAQLPVPLSVYEGFLLSSASGFQRFYAAIAHQLGSDIPSVDWEEHAREVADFEIDYAEQRRSADVAGGLRPGAETVRNPTALCISSPQFMQLGLENQIDSVLAAFPSDVPRNRVFDSMSVRRALSDGKVDIVHLATFVCPRSGTLYFSNVDPQSGKPSPESSPDIIKADEFADLLRAARTSLAVITSGDGLALATSLIPTCHVVAARDMVSVQMAAVWVEAFYNRLLAREPLSDAVDHAIRLSGAPMRLYAKQPKSVPVTFVPSAAKGAGV